MVKKFYNTVIKKGLLRSCLLPGRRRRLLRHLLGARGAARGALRVLLGVLGLLLRGGELLVLTALVRVPVSSVGGAPGDNRVAAGLHANRGVHAGGGGGGGTSDICSDYVLEGLTDCTVFLLGTLRALRCHNLTRCKVYCGPVAGSVHVQAVDGCHLAIPARQVRIHNATNGTCFYIRTLSNPIIEHSTGVGFAPYAFEYPGSLAAMDAAGLGSDPGMWSKVDDFGWIKKQQSPNWSVIPEGERVPPPAAPPLP